jgi:multisubunit Na+/H+ antiporter MnhB subunit
LPHDGVTRVCDVDPPVSGGRHAVSCARSAVPARAGPLAALAFWGFTTPDGALLKILLGVGAPVLAAVVWGTFLSPRASVRVPGPLLVILEMALFAVAAIALNAAGQPTLATALAIAAVAQRTTLSVLGVPAGLTGER